MLRWCLIALGTLAVLSGVILFGINQESQFYTTILPFSKSPLDRRTADILRGATKVEVFRVSSGELDEKPKPGDSTIGGYRVLSHGKNQGSDFAVKLANVLTDRKTYTNNRAACFNPGVAFRVWKGDSAVDIIICFHCSNFYFGPPTDHPHVTASFLGSPNRRLLVQLAKEAFPDDKDIQKINEEE